MKTRLSLILLLLLVGLSGLDAMQKGEFQKSNDIKVYYFHATRRCVTCVAVENVSRKAIKDNYGDEIDFIVINREKEENLALVEKYKVSGQTLIVVKDDKVENLTNAAFMNARKKPGKLEELIISTIEAMKY